MADLIGGAATRRLPRAANTLAPPLLGSHNTTGQTQKQLPTRQTADVVDVDAVTCIIVLGN